MKKQISIILLVSVVAFGQLFCAGLTSSLSDPQKAVCKEACKTVYDECKKKAADDKIKTAACDAAYSKCCDECD